MRVKVTVVALAVAIGLSACGGHPSKAAVNKACPQEAALATTLQGQLVKIQKDINTKRFTLVGPEIVRASDTLDKMVTVAAPLVKHRTRIALAHRVVANVRKIGIDAKNLTPAQYAALGKNVKTGLNFVNRVNASSLKKYCKEAP